MSLNLFTLDGRVALVTGGNGGPGRAMARGLAAAGARVLVTGRSDAKNSEVANELGKEHVISLDVRDEPAVERAIAGIADRFGGLDVLVNNAGLFRDGSALELSREAWDDVLPMSQLQCSNKSKDAAPRASCSHDLVSVQSRAQRSIFEAQYLQP